MPHLTIQQTLLQARQKIDALDAELLLAHVLKKPRGWVLVHLEAKIERLKDQKIKRLLARRANGEPVAYLTGHKEFFGLDFEINKNVLIPRPDTETMVELVIEKIKRLSRWNAGSRTLSGKDQKITMIDVGTGSGCIPVAIANHIRHNFSPYQGEREGVCIKTIAIDISKKALAVAKRNAKRHGVRIKFLHGNLLGPILKTYNLKLKTYNLIITANLPYLTNKQCKTSPTIQHEPKLALVAKDNGLALYKKLLKQIKKLTTYNLQLTTFMEIDPSQSKSITSLIQSILPDAKIQIKKDLAGLDRVVRITNYAA